jgi:hypothetical protein
MNETFPAAKTLINQINYRWPKRINEKDSFDDASVSIDPLLDGRRDSFESAEIFVNEMIQMAKEGLDEDRIYSITYKNKTACNHPINRFWVWQENQNPCDSILIVFNKEKINNNKKFPIELFKTKTRTRNKYPKYPGVSSIKFKRKNKSVRSMQEKLIEKGFYISEEELGYYGQETCEAIKKFYRSLGIYSGTIAKDGKRLGPRGWKRLFE